MSSSKEVPGEVVANQEIFYSRNSRPLQFMWVKPIPKLQVGGSKNVKAIGRKIRIKLVWKECT